MKQSKEARRHAAMANQHPPFSPWHILHAVFIAAVVWYDHLTKKPVKSIKKQQKQSAKNEVNRNPNFRVLKGNTRHD